ncbi:hypothetical protein AB0N73_14820 [Microbacterium sp. NPDC089189]|uniref:hypothetical protein n=1 Tax=Microbacterium sp. NPDC089189 TaxID=3154972 RepID=UPI00341E4942
MSNLDVQIEALESHTAKLAEGGERIGEVAGAALTSVALQPVAFGLMCSFLVPVVMTQQAAALAGMGALSAAVAAEGAAIKAAALGYRAADSELADKIRRLIDMEG